jgi:hypothetical protein
MSQDVKPSDGCPTDSTPSPPVGQGHPKDASLAHAALQSNSPALGFDGKLAKSQGQTSRVGGLLLVICAAKLGENLPWLLDGNTRTNFLLAATNYNFKILTVSFFLLKGGRK